MSRLEAVFLVLIGLSLTISGLVWLFGAFALIGSGLVLLALALFTRLSERGQRDEPAQNPVPWQR